MRQPEDIARHYLELFGETIPPDILDRMKTHKAIGRQRERRPSTPTPPTTKTPCRVFGLSSFSLRGSLFGRRS